MKPNLFALAAIGLWASLAALGVALKHVPAFLLTGVALAIGNLINYLWPLLIVVLAPLYVPRIRLRGVHVGAARDPADAANSLGICPQIIKGARPSAASIRNIRVLKCPNAAPSARGWSAVALSCHQTRLRL